MFVAVGALYIGLAIPLMRRRIPPNGLYGLRVPATFADESVWYDANARAARHLAILGGIQIVLALTAPLFDSDSTYVAVNIAVLLSGTIAMAIEGWSHANRLLRERQATEGDR